MDVFPTSFLNFLDQSKIISKTIANNNFSTKNKTQNERILTKTSNFSMIDFFLASDFAFGAADLTFTSGLFVCSALAAGSTNTHLN